MGAKTAISIEQHRETSFPGFAQVPSLRLPDLNLELKSSNVFERD